MVTDSLTVVVRLEALLPTKKIIIIIIIKIIIETHCQCLFMPSVCFLSLKLLATLIILGLRFGADDASACADLEALKDWLSGLLNEGPKYGYSPKPSKSYVVVNERSIERANALFGPLGVKVVTSHRFLGGVIGDNEGQLEFLKSRVKE